MRILVSGGGTREPIDGVRFITNFSTGATAAALADCFSDRGHRVTCLMAEGAVRPRGGARVVDYTSFESLDRAFREALSAERYDAIIHLAAVSDYSVESIWDGDRRLDVLATGKLDSRGGITLRLKPNFKIVQRLKSYAREAGCESDPRVVAFKLTDTPELARRRDAVERLIDGSEADFVVHNDLGDRRAGLAKFTIYGKAKRKLGEFADARALGEALADVLQEEMHDSRSGCGQ